MRDDVDGEETIGILDFALMEPPMSTWRINRKLQDGAENWKYFSIRDKRNGFSSNIRIPNTKINNVFKKENILKYIIFYIEVGSLGIRCRTCIAGNYPRNRLTVFATFNWIFEFEFVRRTYARRTFPLRHGISSDNWTRLLLWRVNPREVRRSFNGTKGFFRSRREFDVAHQWWAACVYPLKTSLEFVNVVIAKYTPNTEDRSANTAS